MIYKCAGCELFFYEREGYVVKDGIEPEEGNVPTRAEMLESGLCPVCTKTNIERLMAVIRGGGISVIPDFVNGRNA